MKNVQYDIHKLKKIELEELRTFCRICDENGLKYYVTGGTLIGTIRHKGFIPWDDDIDVAMPREDYDKFIKIAPSKLPDYYFLQNNHTDPDWVACFSKIRDSRTTFVETSLKAAKINHGVYIDIFPLDYYPERISTLDRFFMMIYKARVTSTYEVERLLKTRVMCFLSKLLCPNVQSAVRKLEAMYRKEKNSQMYINYGGAWGKKEIAPKKWFGEGTMMEFEDLLVRVPIDYDKYLGQLYGDYMILPPVEKQVGHHYVEKVDLEHSYLDYNGNWN